MGRRTSGQVLTFGGVGVAYAGHGRDCWAEELGEVGVWVLRGQREGMCSGTKMSVYGETISSCSYILWSWELQHRSELSQLLGSLHYSTALIL